MKALSVAAALLAAAVGCTANPAIPETALQRSPAGLEQVYVTIVSGGREHRFATEVAASAEEQTQGLMFRQSIAPDKAMIFPFAAPQQASFWMKNTLIPLDIIFIRDDGTIANIAQNVPPLSLDQVLSEGPVVAVLEIAGGRSAELGIKAGDVVRWRRPDLP